MDDQESWYKSLDRTTQMFSIWDEDIMSSGAAMVGVCGLTHIDWKDRHAEVSIYVALEHRGRGIAGKALTELCRWGFEEFNLHRLWAEIYSWNDASIRLFENAGFVREGVLRQHVWQGYEMADSYIYGLLRWEGAFESYPVAGYTPMSRTTS